MLNATQLVNLSRNLSAKGGINVDDVFIELVREAGTSPADPKVSPSCSGLRI
jgi:hypothetical protein